MKFDLYNEELLQSEIWSTLSDKLNKCDSQQLQGIVNALIHNSIINLYVLVTHLADLSPTQLEFVLKAAIKNIKTKDDLITEDGELEIERIIVPVIERGTKLVENNSFIEASQLFFVILVIIEHEMQFVYDEGVTFQLIIQDCFKGLTSIAEKNYDQNMGKALAGLAAVYNRTRSDSFDVYDDEWNDIGDALARS
jgi:hypothetical protein